MNASRSRHVARVEKVMIGFDTHRAVLGLALVLCGSGIHAASPENSFDPRFAVVFPAERAQELTQQCSRSFSKGEGTWMPTSEQIARFEALLAPELARALRARWGIAAKPADYYRQYGGLVVAGRRVIYVNGFHQDHVRNTPLLLKKKPSEFDRHDFPLELHGSEFWKHQAVNVCDGGSGFWGAAFDVKSETLVTFRGADDRRDSKIQFNGIG
jgi:hypothetical protein